MRTEQTSSGVFEIRHRGAQKFPVQAGGTQFPSLTVGVSDSQLTETIDFYPDSHGTVFLPPDTVGIYPAPQNTAHKMLKNVFAAVYFDFVSPHGERNSRWVEPSRVLMMEKSFRSGKISISRDLIKPREKASESSMVAPSGFLLAWLAADSDDVGDVEF